MYKLVKALIDSFYFLISPPYCFYCRAWLQTRTIFCQSCEYKIQPIVSYPLRITDSISIPVLAISSYTYPIKSLILAKYYQQRLASMHMARLMYDKTAIRCLAIDYIVPVPLHWSRRLKRGYNQADVMAQELSRQLGKPVVHALKRKKRTLFQAALSKDDREKNLQHAFALRQMPMVLEGKTILLVDDLMTTGSTLNHAIRALLPAKPKNIICAVAARVL